MGVYVAKRLALALLTFGGITLLNFAVMSWAPGDAALADAQPDSLAGNRMVENRLRARFDLDTAWPVRYVHWMGNLLRFDLGRSYRDNRPVADKLADAAPATAVLITVAIIVALIVAVPLGVETARRAGRWFDRTVMAICYGIYATPSYVLGMLLILFVGLRVSGIPFVGIVSDNHAELPWLGRLFDYVRHSLLIGICAALPIAAVATRHVRTAMKTILAAPFIRAAKSRGLSPWRVAYLHALPNAAAPLLMLVGQLLPAVLGGAIVLEVMFSWPGMGRLMYDAAMYRDYPVVMGATAVSAFLVLSGTLVIDLLYVLVDPRIQYE